MDLIAWAPIVGPLLAFGGGVIAIRKTARTAESGIEASVRASREQDARSARDRFAPEASAVRAWLDYEASRNHGADVDFYSRSPKGAFSSVSDVLGALRGIADQHPDAEVRSSASALFDSIDNAFGDAPARESSPPELDDFLGWIKETDSLIQGIHTAARPEHQPARVSRIRRKPLGS